MTRKTKKSKAKTLARAFCGMETIPEEVEMQVPVLAKERKSEIMNGLAMHPGTEPGAPPNLPNANATISQGSADASNPLVLHSGRPDMTAESALGEENLDWSPVQQYTPESLSSDEVIEPEDNQDPPQAQQEPTADEEKDFWARPDLDYKAIRLWILEMRMIAPNIFRIPVSAARPCPPNLSHAIRRNLPASHPISRNFSMPIPRLSKASQSRQDAAQQNQGPAPGHGAAYPHPNHYGFNGDTTNGRYDSTNGDYGSASSSTGTSSFAPPAQMRKGHESGDGGYYPHPNYGYHAYTTYDGHGSPHSSTDTNPFPSTGNVEQSYANGYSNGHTNGNDANGGNNRDWKGKAPVRPFSNANGPTTLHDEVRRVIGHLRKLLEASYRHPYFKRDEPEQTDPISLWHFIQQVIQTIYSFESIPRREMNNHYSVKAYEYVKVLRMNCWKFARIVIGEGDDYQKFTAGKVKVPFGTSDIEEARRLEHAVLYFPNLENFFGYRAHAERLKAT